MIGSPLPRAPDRRSHRPPLAAFADGPVADDAAHVAAELVLPTVDLDRDDPDAVAHG